MPPVFPQLLEELMPLANALRHFRKRKPPHPRESIDSFFFFNGCTSRGVYGGGFRPFSKTESLTVGRSQAHPATEWRFEFARLVYVCIYIYIYNRTRRP